MKLETRRIAFIGLLAALAIVFSFLEGLLPPLPFLPPGVKLGLSNIVTMFAAGTTGIFSAIAIAVIKGIFAFLTRGVTAGIMSLFGGILSTLVMWIILKKTKASLSVVGVGGALTHNLAQLTTAFFLTRAAAFYYAPFMLILGVITGLLTGAVLKISLPPLMKVSKHFGIEKAGGKTKHE